MSDERLKIAVFIDFDNIEIGVKSTLGSYFDIGAVLEAIKERGEIVTKIAYGDWTRAGDYGRALSQHAVHMVQRNLTPGGDKNGADINLALDALEMAFTHSHINSFVVISGDSDFISLVEKLKQYDRKVFVVGGRAFTSVVMQKNCTEFIAYENIVGRGRSTDRTRSGGESPLAQAMPLVRRALKLLNDREVLPQLGLLKSTLLQLDSAFSEREYGAGSFRDFVQKLAKAGYLHLKGNERSFHVELREGVDGATPTSTAPATAPSAPLNEAKAPEAPGLAAGEEATTEPTAARPDTAPAMHVIEQALGKGSGLRWPLYVRQVKQLIRAVEPQFDERRYGFGSLIEALKQGQREGLLRVERDRQGIVRVWPGNQFQKDGSAIDQPGTPGMEDAASGRHASVGHGEEETARAEIVETRRMIDVPAADATADAELIDAVTTDLPRPSGFGREEADTVPGEALSSGASDDARDPGSEGPDQPIGEGRPPAKGRRRPAAPRTPRASKTTAARGRPAAARSPRPRKRPKGNDQS